MRIIEKNRELTKKEIYKMTMDSDIISMKDVVDDTIIEVDAFVTFEDTDKDGKTTTITSILEKETGKVYAFQSETFRNSLYDIDEIMEDEEYAIKKHSGVSNAGRPFINCSLV